VDENEIADEMADEDPSVELGAVTIWLPTAGEAKCSVLHDLAETFGLESNEEAVARLRQAWREAGCKGRLDLDHESDFVSIHAGRDAIVDAAALIDRLATPEQSRALSEPTIARVRRLVKAHRRPPRFRWEVGDVFAMPLPDGTFAFGQVLWEQDFAKGSGLRGPTCVLFEHRAATAEADIDAVVTSRSLVILHVSSEHLDGRRWRVIGRREPLDDPFSGPCGQPGKGATSFDGLDWLAHRWHGFHPWNPNFDRYLLDGVRHPSTETAR
jgi:hypothetical protein